MSKNKERSDLFGAPVPPAPPAPPVQSNQAQQQDRQPTPQPEEPKGIRRFRAREEIAATVNDVTTKYKSGEIIDEVTGQNLLRLGFPIDEFIDNGNHCPRCFHPIAK